MNVTEPESHYVYINLYFHERNESWMTTYRVGVGRIIHGTGFLLNPFEIIRTIIAGLLSRRQNFERTPIDPVYPPGNTARTSSQHLRFRPEIDWQ